MLPETTYNKAVTFTSSDENVAKVDKDGNITALKIGECTVKATASDGKTVAECKVKVVVLPEKVSLNSTLLTIEKGQGITLKATVLPENTSDKTITWTSSDESVAKVDKDGKVTTLKVGKAVIKATSSVEGVFAECTVNVKVDSKEIKLSKTQAVVYLGEQTAIVAEVLPADSTNSGIIWSSDNEKIATVLSGVITPKAQGTVTITAKTADTGVIATCKVTVKKHTESLSISSNSETLYVGSSVTLKATVLPEDASNKNVVWTSSDNVVATVDKGVVKALRSGTAVITAKTEEGEFYGICIIKSVQGIDKLSLDKTEIKIDKKESVELKAQIQPIDADDTSVIWTSSDESVATVKDGVVTGQSKSGKAVIKVMSAKNNKVYAECVVTVKEAASSIELSEKEITMAKGDKKTLTAKVLPDNAFDKTVMWTSGDEKIATVKDGVITAVSAGTVEITVTSTAYGISAKCRVTVK